jgi:hypothetical protein
MKQAVLHDRQQETIEAKARWFRSLSMTERMEIFCSITDLALSAHPKLKDRVHAQQTTGRVQVLSAKQR